jgi:hypothetical protein
MAITGHRSLEEVEPYTRAARQGKLADSEKILEIQRGDRTKHAEGPVSSDAFVRFGGRGRTSNYGRFRRSFGVAFQNQSGTRQRSGRCASPHAAIACRIGSRSAPAVVSW